MLKIAKGMFCLAAATVLTKFVMWKLSMKKAVAPSQDGEVVFEAALDRLEARLNGAFCKPN
jgi:hypothetical protein